MHFTLFLMTVLLIKKWLKSALDGFLVLAVLGWTRWSYCLAKHAFSWSDSYQVPKCPLKHTDQLD